MSDVESTILDSVGEVVSAGVSRQSLQEIDRSMQTLECLANCLDAMAATDPKVHTVPEDAVLGAVPLGSVANRLYSGQRFSVDDISGEPELF
ncbi:MAG: hypothetical protein AAFV19_00600 [Pseudomonadota bacterium]